MELSAETVEILQAGRRRVMAGWCQGHLKDESGVCALGALADGRDVTPIEALHALEDDLGLTRTGETATVALAVWNDAPERTLDDVVALFDRVLAKAAARDLVKS